MLISSTNLFLFATDSNNNLKIFDISKYDEMTELFKFDKVHESTIWSIAVSQDSKKLVILK